MLALPLLFALISPAFPPAAAPAVAACAPASNPIVCENSLPGDPASAWDISGSGDSTIQGFATEMSVPRGQTVSFKVKSTASAYRIDVYRIGYYAGKGARKVATVTPSVPLPQTQPACLSDTATGLVDCGNWAISASWGVPADATSGVYVAKLVRTDTGGASHIVFVVRDDASTSAIVFQTSDTTWQAYNEYGGRSLYRGSPSRAVKISYNRPFATRGQDGGYGRPNWLFYGEYPMIRWLEANGYDVAYISGIDTDRRGADLLRHRAFLSVGHDEYWSGAQRANVESARAAGVNLGFFSGNEVFWKIRWENSISVDGTPYRTLVCYKETLDAAKTDPTPSWTGSWRDPRFSPPADGGRPENGLTGTIFKVNRGTTAITVPAEFGRARFWRNTSVATLAAGTRATLATSSLGYEWDEDLDNGARPPGLIRLSETTASVGEYLFDYGGTYGPGTATHRLTLYRHSSGALVFGAGTIQWSWGLDPTHDTFDIGDPSADVRMQQATVNLFADMGVQPGSLRPGVVASSPSGDTTAPSSAITAPTNGSTVGSGATVTITGTAQDAGGGIVAAVEVSTDNGATWHPATGGSSWSYTWIAGRSGTAQIVSRAVDDSGNLGAGSPTVTVTIAGSSMPAFVTSAWAQNNTTLARPANVTAGDLLLAGLEIDADPVTVTGPPGWTRALDTRTLTSGGAFHAQVWWKVATATEPTSYTWGVPSGVYTNIGLVTYMNIDQSAPIDVAAGRDAGSTATPTTPSVTTSLPNDMLVAFFVNYSFGGFTAGSGMTQRFNFDSTTAQDAIQTAAGASGTKTATNTTVGNTAAQLVALRPVQADTTPPAIALTAPAAGATLSGSTQLAASASDAGGVAQVSFFVDGTAVGSPVTASPYALAWDSTSVLNGAHSITAQARDLAGNMSTSAPVSVTVANPTAAPSITNVAATGSANGATVTWTTDLPSDSQVEYGTTTAYGSLTTLDTARVTAHGQTVSGLAPDTLYHYRVKSRQTTGGDLAISADATFRTTTVGPTISSVQASAGTTTATIGWTTDTASDSQVEYGTTAAYGSQTALDPAMVTSHSQALSGLAPSTLYHYRVKSRNAAGALSTSADGTFTTSAASRTCPCSIWPGTAVPAAVATNDSNAVELGLKFTADTSGYITAIRFYKPSTSTGTHVGTLWSATGAVLGRATFTGETASGWQQVTLPSAVAVTAGTTYVVSYHSSNGNYGYDSAGLASAVDNAPLHALASGASGGNGVYAYNVLSSFPTSSWNATNYWVDVVFSRTP